jgi:AraC-like DNA-binding protein
MACILKQLQLRFHPTSSRPVKANQRQIRALTNAHLDHAKTESIAQSGGRARVKSRQLASTSSLRIGCGYFCVEGSDCTPRGHLTPVEEDHGHETALTIARLPMMFLVRSGGQAQFSHMLSHQATISQPLRELQVWMLQNLREDLTVESLADRLAMSARHFTQVCLRETGMSGSGEANDRQFLVRTQRSCGLLRIQIRRCDAAHFLAGPRDYGGRIREPFQEHACGHSRPILTHVLNCGNHVVAFVQMEFYG